MVGHFHTHYLLTNGCEARAISRAYNNGNTLKELILGGARRAEATRAHERIRRLGLILANATIEGRETDADEVEEMMRVATELSDRDNVPA